jgi:hypothetical protein
VFCLYLTEAGSAGTGCCRLPHSLIFRPAFISSPPSHQLPLLLQNRALVSKPQISSLLISGLRTPDSGLNLSLYPVHQKTGIAQAQVMKKAQYNSEDVQAITQHKECRLLGYKSLVRTSQETHYVSATEPSLLMVCNI